jgi:GNAT superfamily N-acetyltransferase
MTPGSGRHPKLVSIRPTEPADASWVGGFLRERWAATTIVVHGEAINAAALIAGDRAGLLTYRVQGVDAELVTLDAEPAGVGTGTALIDELIIRLRTAGCARLWLTTTNDKVSALRFYLRRKFRLMQVRYGAVDRARERKPSIPMIGEHGISMHDELDLCRALDPDVMPCAPPWSRFKGSYERRHAVNGEVVTPRGYSDSEAGE